MLYDVKIVYLHCFPSKEEFTAIYEYTQTHLHN